MRADRIVPLAVEVVALNVDDIHLGIGDPDAGGIAVGVDLALHLEAGSGRGGGNQLDDGLVADERPAAPVLRDEREEAMLDLVPFAGARWEMADDQPESDVTASFCSEVFQIPEPRAKTVAACPPPSAVISSSFAFGNRRLPISLHHLQMRLAANCAVSWSIPTLTQPWLLKMSYTP